MGLLEIILLAVVQGVTEFLPVSSSGHLVVASALLTALGQPEPQDLLEVSIVLHLGTLLSILVFYWHRVWRLLGADRRVIGLLVVAMIPAVAVGLPIRIFAKETLESALLAGLMFPVTGAMLLWASRLPPGDRKYTELSYGQSLVVGLFQAFALLPGVSRSGSTIAAGLSVGLERSNAAAFSFLLAIPAIGGAGAYDVLKLLKERGTGEATEAVATTPWPVLAIGFVLSFAVGLGALSWLVRWVEKGRLYYFAWWLIPLGIAVTAWQLSLGWS